MFITGFPPTTLNGWFFWLLVGLWAVLIVFSYFIGKE